MPLGMGYRRRSRRKFKGKRGRFMRKRGSALRIAIKALNHARPELKNKSVSHGSSISNSGTITNMWNVGLEAGTGPGQYIGKQVRLQNLTYRFKLNQDSANETYVVVRIIIGLFYDSINPLVTDILSTASPFSPYSQGNSTRYKVLWDLKVGLDQVSNLGRNFTKKINFGNLLCSFNQTTVSLPTNVQPFLLEISSATGSNPGTSGVWRIRYTDS